MDPRLELDPRREWETVPAYRMTEHREQASGRAGTPRTPFVAVRFERVRESGEFEAAETFYRCERRLCVGDLLSIPTRRGTSFARVSRIDVPESNIPLTLRPFLATLHGKIIRRIPQRFSMDTVQTCLY